MSHLQPLSRMLSLPLPSAPHLRRSVGVLFALSAACLPHAVATAQGIAHSPARHGTHSTAHNVAHNVSSHVSPQSSGVALPAESVQRVEQFLDELAASVPTLLREGLAGQRRFAQMRGAIPSIRALDGFARLISAYDPVTQRLSAPNPAQSLVALDSLRAAWERTDSVSRAYWFTAGPYPFMSDADNGFQVITGLLIGVVPNGTLVDPAARVAEAFRQADVSAAAAAAGPAANLSVASDTSSVYRVPNVTPVLREKRSARLHQNGLDILAMVQVARGDTTAAIANLRQVMRQSDELGLQAAETVERLATARHDSATSAEALGMLFMKLGGMGKLKDTAHARFVALYPVLRRQNPQLPVDPERYLDGLFEQLNDHDLQVTRYTGDSHHRLVVLETVTGLSCHICGTHDRVIAALMQRYPTDAFVPLEYEYDSPPLSNEIDPLLARVTAWYPYPTTYNKPNRPGVIQYGALPPSDFEYIKGEYPLRIAAPWVNGLATPYPMEEDLDRIYANYVQQIDRLLATPPQAALTMQVTQRGDVVDVALTVDSVRVPNHRLAARIEVVEDTVRVLGATNRRLQYAVVRASTKSPGLPMGIPLVGPAGGHQTAQYRFDLAEIADQYAGQMNPAVYFRKLYPVDSVYKKQVQDFTEKWSQSFAMIPDPANAVIHRDRLEVVAFIQDLDTGEILQATRIALAHPANASANTSAPLASAAVH